jgi:hypothetical protein
MLKRLQHDNKGLALVFVIPNLIRDLGLENLGLKALLCGQGSSLFGFLR